MPTDVVNETFSCHFIVALQCVVDVLNHILPITHGLSGSNIIQPHELVAVIALKIYGNFAQGDFHAVLSTVDISFFWF